MEIETLLILLKDLCARLPYGVICNYNCVIPVGNRSLDKTNAKDKLKGIIPMPNGHIGFMVGIDKIDALEGDIKPYLRPLSSMTEEEKKYISERCAFSIAGPIRNESALTMPVLAADWLIDFYNERHFDYRGLIPMGLALEAAKDMYKTE